VRCRHGSILPGGHSHLRSDVRATGTSSLPAARPVPRRAARSTHSVAAEPVTAERASSKGRFRRLCGGLVTTITGTRHKRCDGFIHTLDWGKAFCDG
jgi:hypothetical protein